jgi:CRP/FNR family cyclic AMP-dependent transcriptional regulator
VPAAGEFLSQLSEGDRTALEAIAYRQTAEPGDMILSRGNSADHVVILESGRVQVSVLTTDGREAVLTFRGPGALLGDQSLVDDSPRSAMVIAVEPVEMLVVAASSFRNYLCAHPNVALVMLATLSARLRESDARLAEYAAGDTLPGRAS